MWGGPPGPPFPVSPVSSVVQSLLRCPQSPPWLIPRPPLAFLPAASPITMSAHSHPGENKMLKLAAAALLAATLALPAHAQDAMKKDGAVKPAGSPSQVVLETWNDVARKVIAMAEDFPEDKYDFKPNPAQRSFAEQLLHASNAVYFFSNPAMGKKMPPEEDPKRADFKS